MKLLTFWVMPLRMHFLQGRSVKLVLTNTRFSSVQITWLLKERLYLLYYVRKSVSQVIISRNFAHKNDLQAK